MTSTPVLFIGPVRAGKTTLARLVAAQLKLTHISLDDLRRIYYREIGYDDDLASRIRHQAGFLAFMFYRQLFDPYSVERVLSDYPAAVIDCGAGVGPYENIVQRQHIQDLLKPLPNVFLLLPSQDLDESLRILKERDPSPPADLSFDINAHFLRHPGYYSLARHTIYTKDKTPEQSCAEVIELLS